MTKVGLTGGIGSGKSTVGRILRVLGVPVFEADRAGRELLDGDPGVRKAVVDRFGANIVADGNVNRRALAAIVFHDREALQDLNAIVHPAVRAAYRRWAMDQAFPYTVMESAILAGSGGHEAFDRIIVVTAPESLRIQRVMRRDGVLEQKVRERIANQVSAGEELGIADYVIHNDDRQLVIPQVLGIHEELMKIPQE